MNTLIALLLLATNPVQVEPAYYRADLLERNNYYDGEGRLVFVQAIWWDDYGTQYAVRDWRMWKPDEIAWQHDGQWRFMFSAGHDGHLVIVDADTFVETWTQHDPEVLDRDRLPECWRDKIGRESPKLRRAKP